MSNLAAVVAKYQRPSLKEFQEYCWEFYRPNGIYGGFFLNKLKKKHLKAACAFVSSLSTFEGNTIDREKVRDILLRYTA